MKKAIKAAMKGLHAQLLSVLTRVEAEAELDRGTPILEDAYEANRGEHEVARMRGVAGGHEVGHKPMQPI